MPREEAESSASARRREVPREALLDSPTHGAPTRTTAKDPPPYGAQHRQDALWEGGNEALPPRWQQFKVLDATHYQDDTHIMSSLTRPLPGVRLDFPGYLIPGCEWHVSPLGSSYFVNHNTRTTSWKKPTPERPAGSVPPEFIIEGHSRCIWSLACFGTGCNILSASEDCSIRQWKRDGESVGKPWDSDGGGVGSIAVSSDETLVVGGSADGRLWLWNIRKGSMVGDPWEGHNAAVWCLDWSPNALEIVSGSRDGTIRRWNQDTGRQIAPPIETTHGRVYAVRYSAQGDKFTSIGEDGIIRVWSKDGELLIGIKGHEGLVTSLRWSKDGAHIFSASSDSTIRKWRAIDGEELVVFRGHTRGVTSLCVSPNESHLVSASRDCTVRIWDLETNDSVGDPLLHDDELLAVAMFSDGKYIASAGLDAKVYVWSLEAVLERQDSDQVGPADNGKARLKGRAALSKNISKQQANIRGLTRYGDNFFADTTHTPHRAAPHANPSSLFPWRSLFGSFRFSARPTNAPQLSPHESRHGNFSLSPTGKYNCPVDVAPARDDDRYALSPPTEAEVAAAMLRTSDTEANGLTQLGQSAPGVQGTQGRPIQTQDSTGGVEEILYEGVTCCGFFFGRRRSTSRQS